jgi:HEAT repeat protein
VNQLKQGLANGNNSPSASSDTGNRAGLKAGRRRTPWTLVFLAVLFVVVPFFAWYGTWFGRSLSDDEIEKYLSEQDKPRHVQHALAQIEKRISKSDQSAKRWYPSVVALAGSPQNEIRLTAAWVMGADTRSEDFHATLVKLLDDVEPIVRRNAALSLVGFGDVRARRELREMLKPFAVQSRTEGVVLTALSEGSEVRRESLLVRARIEGKDSFDVRSPLDGRIQKAHIKDDDRFRAGSDLFLLSPDSTTVRNALAGLKRLGAIEDLAEVEHYAAGVEHMPDDIKQRATETAEAIRGRAEKK